MIPNAGSKFYKRGNFRVDEKGKKLIRLLSIRLVESARLLRSIRIGTNLLRHAASKKWQGPARPCHCKGYPSLLHHSVRYRNTTRSTINNGKDNRGNSRADNRGCKDTHNRGKDTHTHNRDSNMPPKKGQRPSPSPSLRASHRASLRASLRARLRARHSPAQPCKASPKSPSRPELFLSREPISSQLPPFPLTYNAGCPFPADFDLLNSL